MRTRKDCSEWISGRSVSPGLSHHEHSHNGSEEVYQPASVQHRIPCRTHSKPGHRHAITQGQSRHDCKESEQDKYKTLIDVTMIKRKDNFEKEGGVNRNHMNNSFKCVRITSQFEIGFQSPVHCTGSLQDDQNAVISNPHRVTSG